MKRHSFALVDCNNFYAGCEQVFQPQLQKRPVVVLDNSDGIVVARSQETKALDAGMVQPYFKIRRAYERQGGLAFPPTTRSTAICRAESWRRCGSSPTRSRSTPATRPSRA